MWKRRSEEGAAQHRKKWPAATNILGEKNMTVRATRKKPLSLFWSDRLPNLKSFAQASHHNSSPNEDADGEDVWPMEGRDTVGRLGCLQPFGSRWSLPRQKCVLTFREGNSIRHRFRKLRLWRFTDSPRVPFWGPQFQSVLLPHLQCCLFGGFTAPPIFINCGPAAHTGGKPAETKMPLFVRFRKEFKIPEPGE